MSFYDVSNSRKFNLTVSNRVRTALQDYTGLIAGQTTVPIGIESSDHS